MDDIALATLASEIRTDFAVAAKAFATAEARFRETSPAALEGCAFQLARMFNVIELTSLRVAKAFENNVDDEKGWHAQLIRRMTLTIPSVRPALFPEELAQELHELRMFRHVFHQAYVLQLDPRKLSLLLNDAESVTARLANSAEAFVAGVAAMHNLTLPPK